MSLVRLKTLLPRAFARIDSKNILNATREAEAIRRLLQEILLFADNTVAVDYHHGVLTLFSASQTLKHKAHTIRKSIIEKIHKELPGVFIKQLIFKGPQDQKGTSPRLDSQ